MRPVAPHPPPTRGEIRYYKVIGHGRGGETVAPVADCDHRNWSSRPDGPKAHKAIIRLERSTAWRSIQRCGTCQGGGVWRVHW